MSLRLNYVGLEIGIGKSETEFVVLDVYLFKEVAVIVRRIVMLRSNGETEVVDSLGVFALYGNLQYVVFVAIGRSALFVVRFCDFVSAEISAYGLTLALFYNNLSVAAVNVTERYDTADIGNSSFLILKNNTSCVALESREHCGSSTPISDYLVEIVTDLAAVYEIDGFFHRVVSRSVIFVFKTFDIALVVFTVFFSVYRRDISFEYEEFIDVVFELCRMRLIQCACKIETLFCRFIIVFDFLFEGCAGKIIVF